MIYDFIRFSANRNGAWSDGVLPAVASFVPCSEIGVCVEQSEKDPVFSSDRVFALDGEWRVAYADFDGALDTDKTAFFAATLPFCAESETQKTFVAEKTFTVYDDNKTHVLSVEGVVGDFEVYVNGGYVGASLLGGGSFDITRMIKRGDNVVLIRVSENPGDFTRAGNAPCVLSSATLCVKGDGYLKDYVVTSSSEGMLYEVKLDMILGGNADKVAVVFGDGDEILSEPEYDVVNGEAHASLKGAFNAYSSETPYLYDAYIRVFVGEKETECSHVRFAVGSVEIVDKELYVSGQKQKIYGVRYAYSDAFEDELAIIKSFNMNAVMVSGALPAAFYAKCAEYGIYVIQEIPCDLAEKKSNKKDKNLTDDMISDYLSSMTENAFAAVVNCPSLIAYSFADMPDGNFRKSGVAQFAQTCGKPVLGVDIACGKGEENADLPVFTFLEADDIRLESLLEYAGKTDGVIVNAFKDGAQKGVFDEHNVAKDAAVLMKFAFRPFTSVLADNRTIRITSRRAFVTSEGVTVTISAINGMKESPVATIDPILQAGETRDFSLYLGEYGEQTRIRVKCEQNGAHIATETLRILDESVKPEDVRDLQAKQYTYTVRNTSFGLEKTEENAMEKRVFFAPCSSERIAAQGTIADEKRVSDRLYTLSGEWKFGYFEENAPQTFTSADLKDTIELPSSWESSKKAPLAYKTDYPFKSNLSTFKIADDKAQKNAVGIYRKVINVGDTAFGYILSFEKVCGSLELQVNGQYVGFSLLGRAEFDITKYVSIGENELVVIVKRFTPVSYLDGQKGFLQSGIVGDVNLIKYRFGGLRDFETSVKRVGAEFAADITLKLFDGEADEYLVEIKQKGFTLFEKTYEKTDDRIKVSVQGDFKPYHAETAEWYDVFVKTVEKGFVTECVRFPIGFNTVAVSGDTVLYDGSPLKLRGIAYNPSYNEFGLPIGAEDIKRDLALIKKYGFNAVRPTRPPKEEFYSVALMLGLYVIDDCGVNTAFAGKKSDKKRNAVMNANAFESVTYALARAAAIRAKKYPNVVAFFLAEDGNTVCGKAGIKAFRENTTRPVFCMGDNAGDGLCKSLPAVNDAVDMVNIAINRRPVFFPEYALGRGVGCATMNEYEEIIDTMSCCLGGCVAYFCDDVVGGVEGEANGIFSEKRYPYPGADAIRYIYRPLLSKPVPDLSAIDITNACFFRTEDSVYVSLNVIINGGLISKTKLNVTIPPRTTKRYDMFVGHPEGDMLLNVEYRDKKTDELLYTEQHRLHAGTRTFETKEAENPLGIVELFDYVDFTFDCGYVRFNKRLGSINKYVLMGKDVLKADSVTNGGNCFVTNVYRPFTRNLQKPYEETTVKVKSFGYDVINGEKAIVRVETVVGNKKKDLYIVQDVYVVHANGVLSVTSVLNPLKKGVSLMDCFGKQLRLNNAFGNVVYYGNGDKDNYIDMCEHTCVGVYNLNVDKTFEGYSVLQECGNRTNVRYAIVRNNDGEGILLAAKSVPFQLRVSPYSDKEIALSHGTGNKPKQSGVYVDVNAFVSGIGTSEDGYPMPKYVVKAGEHVLKFDIIPVESLR